MARFNYLLPLSERSDTEMAVNSFEPALLRAINQEGQTDRQSPVSSHTFPRFYHIPKCAHAHTGCNFQIAHPYPIPFHKRGEVLYFVSHLISVLNYQNIGRPRFRSLTPHYNRLPTCRNVSTVIKCLCQTRCQTNC